MKTFVGGEGEHLKSGHLKDQEVYGKVILRMMSDIYAVRLRNE
jgi:hypothetical protein